MNENLKYLSNLSWGYRAARVLHTANNLKLFTFLSKRNMSLEEISKLCSAKPELLEKVLIACSAMGLLHREGSLYQNTECAEQYLVEGKPLYQGDIIAHSARGWKFWDSLPEEVLLNPSQQEVLSDAHRDFILGMHNITVGERGKLFIDNIDLSGRKKLFDVGGGPGTYCVLACKRYPDLTAIVFDLPETTAITREIIIRENMQDRISVRQGNWETDDFGKNNDVALLSNILHGPDSHAKMKLQKAYDSLVPGGLLVVQEFLLNDEKTGPLIPALFNVMVGAYSQSELSAIIKQSGFSNFLMVLNCDEMGSSWITAERI